MTTSAHLPTPSATRRLARRRHRMAPRRHRTFARVLAPLAVVPAMLAVTDAPAHAATPRCNYVMAITLGTNITETVPAYTSGEYRPWRCVLRYGDGFNGLNSAVQNLRDTMNVCCRHEIADRWPLSTDGKFGGNTRTALIRVQRSLRISADRIYGPQTAAAMKHWPTARTPYGIFYTCNRIPGQ